MGTARIYAQVASTTYTSDGQFLSSSFTTDGSWSRTYAETQTKASDPKWKSKVAQHVSATLPYARSSGRFYANRGSMRVRDSNGSFGQYHIRVGTGQFVYLTDFPLPTATTLPGLQTEAYLSWIKKASKELRTIQGGVSLGELRETLHAIRHPLESLKEGLRDYLRAVPARADLVNRRYRNRDIRRRASNDIRRRNAISQAISGTYLEYANGWRPLVNEIDSAARTLAEHFAQAGISYRRITATKTDVKYKSSQTSGSYGHPAFTWRGTKKYTYESSVRIIGEVIVRHQGNVDDLRAASGFTLGEFIPTAWELLPLSYVADYFGNIGDVLSSFAFVSSNRAWWSWSERNRVMVKLDASASNGAGTVVSGSPGSCSWQHTAFVRSNPNSFAPSLAFSLPGSHLLSKLANVSSLAAQAVTSSRLINRLIQG